MKKIIQNYSVSLKPIELTFSDIEKICNIFSEENILYRLKTETIEFENFQELQNHSEDIISNLEIYSSEPYISIELKKHTPARLYIAEDRPLSRGILEKIKGILSAKQIKAYTVVSVFEKTLRMLFYISLLVLFSLFIFNIFKLKTLLAMFLLITSFYVVLGFFSASYTTYIESCYSKIYLHKKKESFWKRKKDEIIIVIISALVSGIISFIAGYAVAILTKV